MVVGKGLRSLMDRARSIMYGTMSIMDRPRSIMDAEFIHHGSRIYPSWISNYSIMDLEISIMDLEFIHYGYRIVPLSTGQGPLWRWNFSV
jgi:hypothetical protein